MDTIVDLQKISVFRKTNQVLTDINFSASRGEFVFLTGRVGSGKSSLLKVMYADEQFEAEKAMVAGFDLKKIKYKQIPFLRRKLGIVFQDYKLLSDRTVHDNLKFVLEASGERKKQTIKEKIEQVLDIVGLEGKGKRMPFQLSGGEQQSVGIARAIINDPLLILADEPTGNLDARSSENIMEILTKIVANGTPVIMATHDNNLLKQYPAKIFDVEANQFVA
ncbi:MAG: phosphonate ABC transporter ATP-binding protein [Bacteroidia bacterium]|nr:MAG: phosphonate ABC transporter ATP-binding protein [Bacteroidia bacterium]